MNKPVKRFVLLPLCLITCLLGGCVSVSFNGGYAGTDSIQGSGERVTLEIDAPAYHSVDIRTNLEIIYTSNYADTVRVELYENQVEYLDISLQDGVLLVHSEYNLDRGTGLPIYLYLANPDLEKMRVSGGVVFEQADTIRRESFALEVRGAGSIDLDVAVEKLSLELSGAGNLHITGAATELDLVVSGVGNVEAQHLVARDATAVLSGVGSVELHCTGSLDATVSGTGSLQYWGNPQRVRESVGGMGAIAAME